MSSDAPRSRHRRTHVAVLWRRESEQAWMIPLGMEIIGRWIRDARVRAGYSQSQLMRMSGVHQSTISRLERAKLQGLSLHRLAVLVAVLAHALRDIPVGAR